MGQLTNLYVSQSFQGLLKMTDSTNGLTSTLQTIQTGDGDNSPLQMSLTEVNISGSFSINNVPITGGTGSSGTAGTSGTSGTSGVAGSSGTSGTSGTSGVSGSGGTSGTSGTSGSSGTSGTSGGTGSSGTSGTSGVDGSSGTSGIDGTSGTSGTSGVDGTSGTSGVSPSLVGVITTGSISTTQAITGALALAGNVDILNGNLNVLSSLARFSGSLGVVITGSLGVGGNTDISGSLNVNGNTTLSGSLIGNTVNNGIIKIQSQLHSSSSAVIPFGYITSSNPDLQTNIMFGTITALSGSGLLTNQTGSIVISGSNNIMLGAGNRGNTITQGTYGYLGGSNNIGTVIPTLNTGSVIRPLISTNALQSLLALQFTTSSLTAPSISSNLIYNSTTINHQSGSINYNTNLNLGGVTSTANNITLPFLTSVQGNYFGGSSITLQHISSSITTLNNIVGGGAFTVTNLVSSSLSTTNNGLAFNNNLILGSGNGVWVSGSNTTNRRTIVQNIIGGTNTAVSSSQVGADTHLVSSIVYGQNLIVSASHASANGGSTFVGRYNATGSLQESSQDSVFVVGTGASAGARKNALHIDSSNNIRMTGSVNMSGSLDVKGTTTITGSLNVSGAMTLGFNDGTDNITSIGFGAGVTLYRNATKYTTAIGEFSGTQTKFANGTNNILLGGFNSQFATGSQNFLVLPTGGNFKSGSINIIIGNTENITSGSNNIIIGQAPSSLGPQVDSHFIIRGPSESNAYLFKSGSGANVPIQIGFPVQVTGSLDVTGDLTIASGSGTNDLFMYGHKMFNVGDFYSTQIQSGSAGVSGSVTYNNTGTSYGVTLASSSRLTVANAGVYSITFSAQLKETGGTDTIYLWLKKNGTNVADTGTKTVVRNNDENIMTVEYIVEAAASDYYEIVYQNVNGHAQLFYEAASGNIPATPSIITTVKQVR